ncbi:hypothetical protein MtrunA17_Chr7g0216321 [Medicago truncatula]|uniref:Uncharacterized protein n=1 Tax=Medicago truncatula TaxID=3880 RepID=A0A396GSP8_MEDTR|nr:hypothetical protein MtrunA17_Chr7g0216321 [Medicago truncatula]
MDLAKYRKFNCFTILRSNRPKGKTDANPEINESHYNKQQPWPKLKNSQLQ